MPAPRLATVLTATISRELRTVQRELEAYGDEAQIWETHPSLPNTGGNLAMHAAGNLLHFFGTVYGGTGYVRNRDAEFNDRNVPRAELLRRLDEAVDVVQSTCERMTEAQWAEVDPLAVANRRIRTDEFLCHLAVHLAYHLGQLDYHRRVVTGNAQGVGAVSPATLPSAVPVEA